MYSTGNYTQYPIVYKEKESNEDCIICITESLTFTSEADTTLYINSTSILKSTLNF